MQNSTLSSWVYTPYHTPVISLTIQGNMRAEYDTEVETAQIRKFSTAQIILKSTTPPAILVKRLNNNKQIYNNAKYSYSMYF